MAPPPTPSPHVNVYFDETADTDAVLRALSDPRRRYALTALYESGERLSLETLANRVVAMECDCDEADNSKVVERTVLVALYHTHAPLLAEADLVEFDTEDRSVALTDLGREIQPLET